MKLDILKIDGTSSGEQVELSDDIFGVEPNDHAIYLAVKAFLANQRQGTSKSKERSEVHGGGKKPWKQKGTGRARQGSTRSPQWRGGGVAHGPKPRDLSRKMTKQTGKQAKLMALSSLIENSQVAVLEKLKIEAVSTKQTAALLGKVVPKGRLSLITNFDKELVLGARNLSGVTILSVNNLSTYDILKAPFLVFTNEAMTRLLAK